MNELKSEDVIRALEFCTTDKITLGVPCRNCPYNECNIVGGKGERQTSGTCRSWLMKDALALLREKDAEIERLTQERDKAQAVCVQMGKLNQAEIAKARAEAITEFENELYKVVDDTYIEGYIAEIAEKLKGETDGKSDL